MIDGLFKRGMAYLFDMLIILLVVNSLSSTSVINFQLEDYNKYYDLYIDNYNLYTEQQDNDIETCDDFTSAIEEENITEEEYVSLYEELTNNEQLTDEDYDTVCSEIVTNYNEHKMSDEEYAQNRNEYYYKVCKNSVFMYLLDVVIVVLYFVLFQGFTKGQTLGKKLMRIKVVNIDNKDVSYLQLLIRSLFLFSLSYYILSILSIFILPMNIYITTSNILYYINYYLEMIVILTICILSNRRGIHDMVAKTKVVMLDFKGNIIEENNKGLNFGFGRNKTKSKES